ncbi:uncharacterized protein O3C94_012248 [Discoglossus pictus]
MDSDNPDYVDRLARKYMRKCKVESSTESESDTNNEIFGPGLTTNLIHGTSRKTGTYKLQYLDPYDGDSEESGHSDYSVHDQPQSDCPAPLTSTGLSFWSKDIGSLTGTSLLHDKASPRDRGNPLENEGSDVCMRPSVNLTSKTFLKETWNRFDQNASTLDISMDSGVVTDSSNVNAGHSVLIDGESKGQHHTVNSKSPAGQTRITSENSDFNMLEVSLAKRKFGLRVDSNNEKLRRKKPRVMDMILG